MADGNTGHRQETSDEVEAVNTVPSCRYIDTQVDGKTALYLAVENNHVKTVAVLLLYNADPNIQDNDGNTPLHRAYIVGAEHTIRDLLLKCGADPTIKNNDGKIPSECDETAVE
jgi:hypothetical protein